MDIHRILQKQFEDILEQQLQQNRPAETAEALARLIAAGYESSHARLLICTCIASEMSALIFDEAREGIDLPRFTAKLHALPELPA